MWKKVSLYLMIGCVSFILGTAFSADLFAEKEKDADKKYDMILKKLDEMSKVQNDTLSLVKVIRRRGK